MDLVVLAIATMGRVVAEVNNGGGGVVIDLLNMQWWQSLIALLGVAGLSPAPWILGLATNKLQFTAAAEAGYAKRAAELNEYHAKRLEERDEYHDNLVAVKDQRYADLEATAQKLEAAEALHRDRADQANAALVESTEVVKMTGHIIQELRQAAQEVIPGGK